MPANKNVCSCPNPPGGQTVCEPRQLAICRVRNGVVEAECIDPPPGMVDPTSYPFRTWALEKITGKKRSRNAVITAPEAAILESGEYTDPSSGEQVSFRLPDEETDTGGMIPATN